MYRVSTLSTQLITKLSKMNRFTVLESQNRLSTSFFSFDLDIGNSVFYRKGYEVVGLIDTDVPLFLSLIATWQAATSPAKCQWSC